MLTHLNTLSGGFMPTFRRLSDDEVAELGRRRRNTSDLTEYVEFIRSLDVGEGGEVSLTGNEQKRTVKRRLSMAARQMSADVSYHRSNRNVVRFQLNGINSVAS
jgi:hypothetical protein